MPGPLDLALAAAAFVGHFSLAVWLFNRLHAFALPRLAIKISEKVLLLAAALVVVAFGVSWLNTGLFPMLQGYAFVCWLAAAAAVPMWLLPKLLERPAEELVANDTRTIDVRERLGFPPVHGAEFRLWSRFPGNQMLHLAVQEKTLRLPRLPRELDGLRIAHLSDLHMTGHLGREFYDVIVDETNALNPDLVVITGDILEKTDCLPWIPETLGRLQARHGKFFILGNHEKRLPDVAPLRAAMTDCGFTDLGGRCELISMDGVNLLLAGNELPWFGAAPDMNPVQNPKSKIQNPPAPFRILLSHSPDQLPFARANQFDLMLAGHNHGGQIRLPYLGALITPSCYGFRYAGGLYFEPPTLLHVSRGLGGIHPIRLNCPPELALLVLTG
jgi:predicted MPP superfamily phosphohydrolase